MEGSMKRIIVVSIVSLGLLTGASPWPPISPSPSLPSPCNLGAMVALASSSDTLVRSERATAAMPADERLADYKCAGDVPSSASSGTRSATPSTKK
jgi:hypothetical protein